MLLILRAAADSLKSIPGKDVLQRLIMFILSRKTYIFIICLACLLCFGIYNLKDVFRRSSPAIEGIPADKNGVVDIENSKYRSVVNKAAYGGDVIDRLRDNSSSEHEEKKLGLYMVTYGRLGNNLYQYASLYCLSRLTGRTPYWIDGDYPSKNPKNSIYRLFPNLSIKRIKHLPKGMKPKSNIPAVILNVTSEVFNIRNSKQDYQLCCYPNALFEEPQVFSGFENDIFLELSLDKELIHQSQMFLRDSIRGSSKASNVLFVGVHARRTDMVTYANKPDAPWAYVAGVDYFAKAVHYYEHEFPAKNLTFVVASDDRKWVTHNVVNITQKSSVVFSRFERPIEDMILLAQCNHTVISSGTFGRWAAWFSGGHVVQAVPCDPENKTNICLEHIPAWRI